MAPSLANLGIEGGTRNCTPAGRQITASIRFCRGAIKACTDATISTLKDTSRGPSPSDDAEVSVSAGAGDAFATADPGGSRAAGVVQGDAAQGDQFHDRRG